MEHFKTNVDVDVLGDYLASLEIINVEEVTWDDRGELKEYVFRFQADLHKYDKEAIKEVAENDPGVYFDEKIEKYLDFQSIDFISIYFEENEDNFLDIFLVYRR